MAAQIAMMSAQWGWGVGLLGVKCLALGTLVDSQTWAGPGREPLTSCLPDGLPAHSATARYHGATDSKKCPVGFCCACLASVGFNHGYPSSK